MGSENDEIEVNGSKKSIGARLKNFAKGFFSCSLVGFQEEENKSLKLSSNGTSSIDGRAESNRDRQSGCEQFMFPCRGGVLNSPSSDTEWIDDHNLDSSSSSSSDSSDGHNDSILANVVTATSRGQFISSLRSSNLNPSTASSSSVPNSSNYDCSFDGGTEIHSRRIIRVNTDEDIDAVNSQWYNHLNQNLETRTNRRNGFQQDRYEGNAQFSRTMSVGRLRDRVLRRSSIYNGLFAHELSDERRVGNHGTIMGRRALRRAMDRTNQGSDLGSTSDQPSVFLERRRRLRYQISALQRLGNRMESDTGHEMPCLLCNQSSSGLCTCESRSRPLNAVNSNTNARSSISRIVLLAEALFEVLDEIHQQAAVLAARPSVSSPLGAAPAPKEVVDHIPLRTHRRGLGQKEASQCYICLLEYEEGDLVRVLPCGHEFHQSCVDKWLKEIHRVCPLCRGDVCISELAQPDKLRHRW